MPNLSLDELQQILKMRRLKGHKIMSKERLLSALDESERNFNNAQTKKVGEDFNKLKIRFLKPKIKEIRRSLYEIENKSNLSNCVIELEESLFKL